MWQARVFFKATATLEKSFSAHRKAVSVLEDIGNYEQVRSEE